MRAKLNKGHMESSGQLACEHWWYGEKCGYGMEESTTREKRGTGTR
jgi:hypothetical protein